MPMSFFLDKESGLPSQKKTRPNFPKTQIFNHYVCFDHILLKRKRCNFYRQQQKILKRFYCLETISKRPNGNPDKNGFA
jgi:hypothetical protein